MIVKVFLGALEGHDASTNVDQEDRKFLFGPFPGLSSEISDLASSAWGKRAGAVPRLIIKVFLGALEDQDALAQVNREDCRCLFITIPGLSGEISDTASSTWVEVPEQHTL